MTNEDRIMEEHIKEGIKLLESMLEEVYITKRFLVTDGVPEDVADDLIRDKVTEMSQMLGAMTDDEYIEYIEEYKVTLEEKEDEAMLLDTDDEESIACGMAQVIVDKVTAIMVVVRGLAGRDIDANDISMALMDKAEELNERYMNMSLEDFDKEVISRVGEFIVEM